MAKSHGVDQVRKDLTEQDAAATRAMRAYWVAFAKSGVPEVAGQPEWPTYNPQLDVIMDFTNAGPVVGPDPGGPGWIWPKGSTRPMRQCRANAVSAVKGRGPGPRKRLAPPWGFL